MNYQEFLEEIKTQVALRLTDEEEIRIQPMLRNNGTGYDGMIIVRKDCNISPTIYLTPYYHRYLDGVCLDDIYSDILSVYHTHLPAKNFDTRQYTDFSNVQSKIVMRLIHYEKNQTLLSQIPHVQFHDLAIVFACLLTTEFKDQASILIRNEHLSLWNIKTDTLYALAKENSPALLPLQITPLEEILKDYPMPAGYISEMYVLSNENRVYGASVILYNQVLASLAEKLNTDLILLPSSIHEWIALPSENCSSLDCYNFMVQEVNETQLADEEFLSDHAYLYDFEKKCLLTRV